MSEIVVKKPWDAYLDQQMKKSKVRAAFEEEKEATTSLRCRA